MQRSYCFDHLEQIRYVLLRLSNKGGIESLARVVGQIVGKLVYRRLLVRIEGRFVQLLRGCVRTLT